MLSNLLSQIQTSLNITSSNKFFVYHLFLYTTFFCIQLLSGFKGLYIVHVLCALKLVQKLIYCKNESFFIEISKSFFTVKFTRYLEVVFEFKFTIGRRRYVRCCIAGSSVLFSFIKYLTLFGFLNQSAYGLVQSGNLSLL